MSKTAIKQHVPIFISSTYEDLVPYREEIQRVITRMEHIIKGMEYFGSSPQNSLDTCIEQVQESKIFIGIVGMRYGSVDDETGLSYSQLEYEEAIKRKIPTLIYIIDENHPIPSKYVDTGEQAIKLKNFKSLLKRKHTVSFFTSPSNLAEKISHDIIEVLSKDELVKVDIGKNSSSSFLDTYKKYELRPLKYYGETGVLTMKIVGSYTGCTLKPAIVTSLGLTLADTISTTVSVLNEETLKPVETKDISIYADQEQADWLIDISKGTIIRAEVKLSHCITKEISQYDGGSMLREVVYTGLLLLQEGEIISSK